MFEYTFSKKVRPTSHDKNIGDLGYVADEGLSIQ